MREQFRHIVGFPGYSVGHLGSVVKEFKNGKRVNLKTRDDDGYRAVALWKGGKRKVFYVHRLVLEAFVGPCPDGFECRHGDGNRARNALRNLCWGTPAQNVEDRKRHGTHLQGERVASAKLTEKKVRGYLAGKYGDRQAAAARLGVTPETLAKVEKGEAWRICRGGEAAVNFYRNSGTYGSPTWVEIMSQVFDLTAAEVAMMRAAGEDNMARLAWADDLEAKVEAVKCKACGGSGEDRPKPFRTAADVVHHYVGPVGKCPVCKGDGWVSDGRRERADLVRLQVEIAKLESKVMDPDISPQNRHAAWDFCGGPELVRAERNRVEWGRLQGWWGNVGLNIVAAWRPWLTDSRRGAVIRRGFVGEVRLNLAEWLGKECPDCRGHGRHADHSEAECTTCGGKTGTGLCGSGRVAGIGPLLVRRHPISRVCLVDCVPYWNGGGWSWYNVDRHNPRGTVAANANLPACLFSLLPTAGANYQRSAVGRYWAWARAKDAHDALSFAALEWALTTTE